MRKRTWLTWAVALLVLAFVPLTIDGKPAPVNFKTELTKLADRYLPNYDAQQSTSSTQKRETSSADQTPIENIVQGKTLKKTYYYHFASDVSSSAQVAFEAAVATYNATGLVKLVAGNATDKQNSITFFVYEKQMSSANTQQGMIESGHGGPKIIQQTGWGAYTVNHARAGLNVAIHNRPSSNRWQLTNWDTHWDWIIARVSYQSCIQSTRAEQLYRRRI